MANKDMTIIGISGASASGKTLLANTIIQELGSEYVGFIQEDSYYHDFPELPFSQRCRLNYDHPNAYDHTLLLEHLNSLHAGKTIQVPIYNHANHAREQHTRTLEFHPIIVLEGILLLYEPNLRELMNIKLFMDTPLDICLIRRLRRDIIERKRSLESVLQQYEEYVRPMYLQFIEPTKRYADLIIPRGGNNRIAIDLIKSNIRESLKNYRKRR